MGMVDALDCAFHGKEQEMQQKKHGNAFAAGAAKWAEGREWREMSMHGCAMGEASIV